MNIVASRLPNFLPCSSLSIDTSSQSRFDSTVKLFSLSSSLFFLIISVLFRLNKSRRAIPSRLAPRHFLLNVPLRLIIRAQTCNFPRSFFCADVSRSLLAWLNNRCLFLACALSIDSQEAVHHCSRYRCYVMCAYVCVCLCVCMHILSSLLILQDDPTMSNIVDPAATTFRSEISPLRKRNVQVSNL